MTLDFYYTSPLLFDFRFDVNHDYDASFATRTQHIFQYDDNVCDIADEWLVTMQYAQDYMCMDYMSTVRMIKGPCRDTLGAFGQYMADFWQFLCGPKDLLPMPEES